MRYIFAATAGPVVVGCARDEGITDVDHHGLAVAEAGR
jgi:hypothetical protein